MTLYFTPDAVRAAERAALRSLRESGMISVDVVPAHTFAAWQSAVEAGLMDFEAGYPNLVLARELLGPGDVEWKDDGWIFTRPIELDFAYEGTVLLQAVFADGSRVRLQDLYGQEVVSRVAVAGGPFPPLGWIARPLNVALDLVYRKGKS